MGVGLDAIEAVPRWRCAEENGHLGALHARRKGETGPFRRRWEHRGPIPAETLQREVVRPIRELESESQNGNSGSTFICGSPAAKSNLSVRSSVFQVLVPRYLNRKIQERKSHPLCISPMESRINLFQTCCPNSVMYSEKPLQFSRAGRYPRGYFIKSLIHSDGQAKS